MPFILWKKRVKVVTLWNFTNVDLTTDESVFVENVHFADSLLTLSYRILKKNESEKDRI